MTIEKWHEFEISNFTEDVFEEVAALFHRVYSETYTHFDRRFFEPARFRSILRDHTLPKMKIVTAVTRGTLAGFIAFNTSSLDQLYVDRDFRGKGLGGRLVDICKAEAQGPLDLYTFRSNARAIAFYERHGFQIVEFSIAPDEREPDVLMRWPREQESQV